MKNNTPYKIFGIALTIAGIIAGVCLAYGALNNRVETQDKRIEKVETKAETNQMDVVEIKTDIKYIKESVDRIEKKL